MPELPEVETVRRRLEPILVGRCLDRVDIRDPRVVRPLEPLEVAAELEGERVAALDRRGKYLIVRFESGRALLIHLRMTGTLRHGSRGAFADDPHARVVVNLDDGSDVVYRDVRRFGTWLVLEPEELDPYLGARVGAEPLERRFTSARLAERLAGRRAPLKAALLDQRTLAGMGNIYADEALWRARLHPLTPAGDVVDPEQLTALVRAVKDALRAGIARQGATLRDYAQPNGARGRMQHEFKVYGRGGEPCERCGTPIEKIRVAGRGTWFCPTCQPRPTPEPAPGRYAARSSSSNPRRSSSRSSV
jgi:formamidopyrimidine-DNA glycosylase